ncbi:MAG: MurR/RpiR family transcriptional regulator [Corynebacterium sp.]|nr:MurR/RpiR family transcriptional regulator [Corynebacterium sp.]
MLIDALREASTFTHQERLVADYILEHLDQVEKFSIADIASGAFTSQATVVRLSKKVGCEGFKDMKTRLLVEVNQKSRIEKVLAKEPITGESSPRDIARTIPVLYDKVITNTQISLDEELLYDVAAKIAAADKIEFYGAGVTYYLAQAAAFKMSTLGKEAVACGRINHHYVAARRPGNYVAIMLSFTGANQLVATMAKYLKEHTDTYILGVVGPHYGKITHYCDGLIEIPNRDSVVSLDVISSYAASNYVLDVLFGLALAADYNHPLEAALGMPADTEKHAPGDEENFQP